MIVAISLVTSAMGHFGLLAPFETVALDSWVRLAPLRDVDRVVIVEIGESDYAEYFDGRSPLDTTQLGDILGRVLRGHPMVVGIDLETNPTVVGTHVPPDARGDAPVIWAASALVRDSHVILTPETERTILDVPSGLALLPRDRDGLIRSYERSFPLERGSVDSFPWALVKTYCARLSTTSLVDPPAGCTADAARDANRLLLNFAANRYRFHRLSIHTLLKASTGEGWATAGPLRDRVVIVGGTYRAARDEYVTPVGAMAGVELNAQAVATELEGGGIRFTNELAMFTAEMIGGFLIGGLQRRLGWLPVTGARWLGFLGLPVLAFVSSLFAFTSLARWINFVPVLFGALLHELYEGRPSKRE